MDPISEDPITSDAVLAMADSLEHIFPQLLFDRPEGLRDEALHVLGWLYDHHNYVLTDVPDPEIS